MPTKSAVARFAPVQMIDFESVNFIGRLSRCSAVGSAPALGAGGREFESRHLDHISTMVLIRNHRAFSAVEIFITI